MWICLMIVDDNPEMRRVMRRTFAGVATTIVECDSGTEALAAYGQWHPNWVLMDIEMERGDGITATRRITTAFPAARVIIVTGHTDEPLRAAAIDAGACGYVLKENLLDLRRLMRSAGEIASRRSARSPERGAEQATERAFVREFRDFGIAPQCAQSAPSTAHEKEKPR